MAHSKVRLDMGDVVKMVIPNYKPKSYSISALRRDEFDVTLKVYPDGRASGFLDRLTVGDQVQSFGMSAGRLYNPGPIRWNNCVRSWHYGRAARGPRRASKGQCAKSCLALGVTHHGRYILE